MSRKEIKKGFILTKYLFQQFYIFIYETIMNSHLEEALNGIALAETDTGTH